MAKRFTSLETLTEYRQKLHRSDGVVGRYDNLPDGVCLLWSGGVTSEGYGQMRVGSKARGDRVYLIGAHKFMWLFCQRFPHVNPMDIASVDNGIIVPEMDRFLADIRTGALRTPKGKTLDHKLKKDDGVTDLCSGNELCCRNFHLQLVRALTNVRRGAVGGYQVGLEITEEETNLRARKILEAMHQTDAPIPLPMRAASLTRSAGDDKPVVGLASAPVAAASVRPNEIMRLVDGVRPRPKPVWASSWSETMLPSAVQDTEACSRCGTLMVGTSVCGKCLQASRPPEKMDVILRLAPPGPKPLRERLKGKMIDVVDRAF